MVMCFVSPKRLARFATYPEMDLRYAHSAKVLVPVNIGSIDEVFGLNISTNVRINNKKLTIAPNRRAKLEDEDVEFRRYLEKNG